MPWKVINQMDIKIELIKDWDAGRFSITDLSQKYMVSRPTIYKWLRRTHSEMIFPLVITQILIFQALPCHSISIKIMLIFIHCIPKQ
jgi:hypothetical protein